MTFPKGANIGTSSLRRQAQIMSVRPDFVIHQLRGNVGTRLQKLKEGKFDAIILAAAGVKRLGLAENVSEYLSTGDQPAGHRPGRPRHRMPGG